MSFSKFLKTWCVYQTTRVTNVQDIRLGLLYYGLLFLILIWIIFNVVFQGSYLEKLAPVAGSVRLTAQSGVPNNLTGINSPIPSYCANSSFNTGGCLFWNPEQIVFPYAGEVNTLFITTRVSIATAIPNPACNYISPTSASCQPPSFASLPKTSYYIANTEGLTYQIDHNIRAQGSISFGITTSEVYSFDRMTGTMSKVCNSNSVVTKKFDTTYRSSRPFGTPLDVLSINDILAAANCDGTFSYDRGSTAPGAKAGEPVRSTGIIVSIPISYTNKGPSSSLNYDYAPSIIQNSEYKTVETVYNSDGSITYWERHGIRLVFAQTGQIGFFSPLALILNFVAGRYHKSHEKV
jgi:hypothetical protein